MRTQVFTRILSNEVALSCLAGMVPTLLAAAIWYYGISTGESRPTTSHVQFFSMGLQIAGLAVVAGGLSNVRKQFGLKGLPQIFLHRLGNWLSTVLSRKPVTANVGVSECSLDSLSAKGTATQWPRPEATEEERLQLLEENLKIAFQLMEHDRSLASKGISTLEKRWSDDWSRLQEEVRTTDGKLREYATGGLMLESVGLCWLLLATVTGAFPAWFADLLSTLVVAIS